jgi:hypothetical protein
MDEDEWEELVREFLRTVSARSVDRENEREGLQVLIDTAQHELEHLDDDVVEDEEPLDLEAMNGRLDIHP